MSSQLAVRPSSLSDPTLQRALQGCPAAWDRLWKLYQPRAYRFAFQLCKTPEGADDLVSEGFFRAIAALPNYRGTAGFATWLNSIIRNCYLDGYRRSCRFPTTSLSRESASGETMVVEIEDPKSFPMEDEDSFDQRLLIDKAVAKLPTHQRVCVALFYFESMGVEEIGKALGVTTNTVKTRLHRARQLLRQTLYSLE